ncbi:DUF3050 domain-containing protein [Yinghuangia sp. KLBMP8922]|uniref:DUF3050 domain-containing protein n=2 Tax=Yinghuangia soli TaxID=2908204 RepID=A0AA41U2Y1_9ACTN|nr:DUF3050 domain-containing protein [Yinghuangia soli]
MPGPIGGPVPGPAAAATNGLPRPPADAGVLGLPRATRLLGETAPARQRVLRHPVYRMLSRPDDIRVFMEHHVFAVWDFMSLLTVLQRELTCVAVPWTPRGHPEARRLVNEIVLTEESDETSLGPRSHFEMYLEAMGAAGADTAPVLCFLDLLSDGLSVPEAVQLCGAPPAAAAFVAQTWRIVEHAPVHCVAAAFALGREELVPRMFEHVLGDPVATGEGGTAGHLPGPGPLSDETADFTLFREYLQRHIEVDGDEHGPMALRLLEDLCGLQPRRWRECAGTVTVALRARATLWDAVAEAVRERRAVPAYAHR